MNLYVEFRYYDALSCIYLVLLTSFKLMCLQVQINVCALKFVSAATRTINLRPTPVRSYLAESRASMHAGSDVEEDASFADRADSVVCKAIP